MKRNFLFFTLLVLFSLISTASAQFQQTGNPQENQSALQETQSSLQGSMFEQVLGSHDLNQTSNQQGKINIESTPQVTSPSQVAEEVQQKAGGDILKWIMIGGIVLGVLAIIAAAHKILSDGSSGNSFSS